MSLLSIRTSHSSSSSMDVIEIEEVSAETARAITAWDNCKANWWKIHADEDEEDGDDKAQSKFEPVSLREWSVFIGSCAGIAGLAMVFRKEPLVASSITGSTMCFSKKFYIQLPQGSVAQNGMRVVALASLTAGLIFHHLPNMPAEALLILNAIPFSNLAMAVFAKCDLNKLKPGKKIAELLNQRFGTDFSTKNAEIVSTIAEGALATGLMNPGLFGNSIAAAGAVLSKVKMRRLIDTVWQSIETMEDPAKQNKALLAAYGSLFALTGASVAAAYSDAFTGGLSLIPLGTLIVTSDTLVRTGKMMIKSYEIPEEESGEEVEEKTSTLKDKLITVGKGIAILGATAGIAAIVGPEIAAAQTVVNLASNPGFAVTVCQESIGLLKVATKKNLPQDIALGSALTIIILISSLSLIKDVIGIDSNSIPGYGASLFFLTCCVGLSQYLMRDCIHGPKKKKENMKVVELPDLAVEYS